MLAQAQKLLGVGKPEQARASLARALQKEPQEPWLNNAMAVTFVVQGQHQQAHYYAMRAARLQPGNVEFQCTLAGIQTAMGAHQDAVATLEPIIAAHPKSPNPRLAIANALAGLEQHAAAAEHCKVALASAPSDREVALCLMQSLLNTGEAEKAVELARRVLPAGPVAPEQATWLPYALNYVSSVTPEESLAAHRAAAEVIEKAAPPPRPATTSPEPDRIIRIGLVSPDFRSHSVAFFAEPLLKHLDRERVHVTCYSTAPTEDATTQRLKASADQWRHVASQTSTQIAAAVRNDRIDVLIDLAGLTGGERLTIFAERPAPVQITYLGYPNTTGLAAIDYRIVDGRTDPPGSERWCTERLLRLDPSFICYVPAPGTPLPAPEVPSRAAGHVTFGSFNTLIKLSDATVGLWASVLRAAPNSKLMLKCRQLADPLTREATVARFSAAGINPARITVVPATKSLADHLALYAGIDVGLDPIPYAGTTTTCEAMWMGVPVVTLEGTTHASRVGVSLLHSARLEDLIARDPESYVAAAVSLGNDETRRAELRSNAERGLRAVMTASPLCDAPALAARFESLIRGAWRDWCTTKA